MRLMPMQLVIKKRILSIISAYAPCVGCTDQDNGLLQQIPDTEHVITAGYLNGHIGASREGFERWHGGKGY